MYKQTGMPKHPKLCLVEHVQERTSSRADRVKAHELIGILVIAICMFTAVHPSGDMDNDQLRISNVEPGELIGFGRNL
ncbi:MAG: hypothetical protein JWR19_1764 [Pedosphaera sp.]|nr:hypothetical protein [Pedosphaera sp.]